MKNISKKQVDQQFKELFFNDSICTSIDKPLRCEAYNNYVDALHKDGIINDRQVNNYCIPKQFLTVLNPK